MRAVVGDLFEDLLDEHLLLLKLQEDSLYYLFQTLVSSQDSLVNHDFEQLRKDTGHFIALIESESNHPTKFGDAVLVPSIGGGQISLIGDNGQGL